MALEDGTQPDGTEPTQDEIDAYDALGGLSAFDLSKPADVANAIRANAQAQARYFDKIGSDIKSRRYGPSDSEKLFALSSAFFAPTKVRGFSGTMANVMPVLQKFGELRRTGEQDREEALQKLAAARAAASQGSIKNAIELQRMMSSYAEPLVLPPGSVVVSKRDPTKVLTTTPAAEENIVKKDGREFIRAADGTLKPLSSERKWRSATPAEAAQYGATAGQIDDTTGEFKPIEAKPQRSLSATEQKMLLNSEDVIASTEDVLRRLNEVMELSPTALEGGLTPLRKQAGQLINSTDPAFLAAIQMDTLLSEIALGELKSTFPGAITEGEREFLVKLKGSSSLPRAAREALWKSAMPRLQRIIQRAQQRIERINSGYYSSGGGNQGKTIRYDKNGNRI